jgi:hypothetical protein
MGEKIKSIHDLGGRTQLQLLLDILTTIGYILKGIDESREQWTPTSTERK